jgi:putative thioredoxin
MAASPYVVNVTAENFQQVVLEGSHERPVLVDFWAEWCAPCRMLGPLLDHIAAGLQGKLLVAKVNTEEQQSLAMQFGIRSLPTVQLFRDGQVVDEFMGALPESEIRAFLERHIPRESDTLLSRADALLARGDADGAAALLSVARADDPDNPRIGIAEARLLAVKGDFDAAEQTLNALPLDAQDLPEIKTLRARIGFDRAAGGSPDPAVLTARLARNPDDSAARYQLASHKILNEDYAGALEELLILLRRDRQYGDDAARKAMVQVFDLLGGSGDLVTRYRAKMTSALF